MSRYIPIILAVFLSGAILVGPLMPIAPALAQEEATGDYYTIKYNENGTEIWHTVYDSRNWDYAYGVAVDSQGNVIVTGATERWHEGELNYDYYTIKYDRNGIKLWDATYDGGDRDEAFAVAVDSEGNVIVTGRSHSAADNDYCTIKYNGTDGSEVWDEPAIYDGGGADGANSVAVDSEDNIVVTGYSSDGITLNYCTIKYDEDGNVVAGWPVIYDSGDEDGALEVAVDLSDNSVIVTGGAGRVSANSTSGDYCTIKYNSTGTELWRKTYNIGPDATSDTAFGAAVDSAGNVLVTGSNYTPPEEGQITGKWHYYRTIKYSPDGTEITNGWPATYDGGDQECAYGVAVDLSDNSVIVTGKVSDGTTWNYYTIKYNSAGTEQWSRSYDGGNWDSCLDVAVDSEGNVIVTGSSQIQIAKAHLEATITSPVGTEIYSTCQHFDLTFTIHNSGEADALDVVVTIDPGATAEVEDQGQGVPWTTPILGEIPGGGAIGPFTYDMHCTGSGDNTITVTPAGTDESTGVAITDITADNVTVHQQLKAHLEAEISSPVGTETYSTCQHFNLTFTIDNIGEADALDVTATIDPGATAEVEDEGQGVPWTTPILGDIPGGGTIGPFTYDMHSTTPGDSTINVTPAGTDENTGVAITDITADSVTVEQVSRLSWAVIAGIAVGSVAVAVGIFFAIRKWVWKKGVPG